MSLISLFSDPDTAAKNDAEVLAWLGDAVQVSIDNQIYHWNGVQDALVAGMPGNGLTLELAAFPVSTLQSVVGFAELDRLLTTGCQISLPAFQAQCAALLPKMTGPQQAVLSAIAAIGQPKTNPRWQTLGLQALPQLADLTVARAQWDQRSKIITFRQTGFNELLDNESTTIQQLKDAVNNYAWS